MVKHKKRGPRSKTRTKYRKSKRQKGSPNVNVMLRKFEIGDIVHVGINPSVHIAMPFRRFVGTTGTVEGKRGECYFVKIKDVRAQKKILVHPVHLKLQKKTQKPKRAAEKTKQ